MKEDKKSKYNWKVVAKTQGECGFSRQVERNSFLMFNVCANDCQRPEEKERSDMFYLSGALL